MSTQGPKETAEKQPTAERLKNLADRVMGRGALSADAAADLAKEIELAADRAIARQRTENGSAKKSLKPSAN